jgi:diguanylate cyclase (GGDEF)-like protein
MLVLLALVFLLMAGFLILLSLKNRQIEDKKNQISDQAAALRKVKNSLVTAQQVAHLGSWEREVATDNVTWSDEVFRIFGEQPQSFQPSYERYLSYLTAEGRDKLETVIAGSIANKTPFEVELKISRKDDSVRYIRELGYVCFSDSGEPTHVIGTTLDITDIKNSEQVEKLRFEQVERYQDALLEWSRVDYKNVNEALRRATEISAQTMDVERVSIWIYNTDRTSIRCEMLYLASSGEFESGMELFEKDFPGYFRALESGKLMAITDAWNDERTCEFTESYLEPLGIVSMLDAPIFYHGSVIGVVCHEQVGFKREWSSQDREFSSAISKTVSLSLEIDKRRDIEEQLEHQAYHDDLTNLPNRSLFLDRLDQAIKQANRANNKLAVLFLDLDNFKEINDSLGHATGDQVLVYIANKLRENLREVDTIARLGGDEFTLIINSIDDVQPINHLVDHLVDVLQQSMVIGDNELYITSSIGVSVFPDDGDTPEDLLRNADAAMYKAKDEGRNSYQFYTQDMTERAFQRVLMEANLRRALENEEFVVYYQPQYDVEQQAFMGMEALVRWEHPEMGMVSPAQFIPMAEETGLIVQIDRWVMRTAMAQVSEWYRDGLKPGKLALNLAVKQLYQSDLLEMIGLTMRETGFMPQWLALEITESEIMKKPEMAIKVLQRISELGIEIAIDDFGTGYSSLSYLKRLPVDKLKIDQSFVRDVPGDGDDEAIVQAVIALARSMGLDIIAEGVETDRQQAFLLKEGCSQIQGYLYGRPMPAGSMHDFLDDIRAVARA